MPEMQSFLWVVAGIVLLFVVLRVVKTVFKWLLMAAIIVAGLYYYPPTRHYVAQWIPSFLRSK